MNRIIALLLLIIALPLSQRVAAQEAPYKFDMGGQVGMSGYIGDASSSIFSHPGIAAGLTFRYLPDVRWGLRTIANVMTLSGDTKGMDDVFPNGAQYDFKSTVVDLQERVEFNFFPYGIGETYKRLRRWTPYLGLGIGMSLSFCDGETNAGFCVPMAFGFRYKASRRVNLALEFSMTKVFSDHMDGQLSDLHEIKSSFARNTDWYSNISFGLTYEFGERCETCHYVD
jgi:hypothetical protein